MSSSIEILLGLAAGLWLLGAACALLATTSAPCRLVASMASTVGGAAAIGAGSALALYGHGVPLVTSPVGSVLPTGQLALDGEPLAAAFVVLLGAVGVAIGVYAPRYHRAGRATSLYLAIYDLALVASLGVLLAANVVTFLVAWESMTVLCYLLVLRFHRRAGVTGGAFLFLALGEVGFVLIFAAFTILAAKTGTTDLLGMAKGARHLSTGWRSTVFVLALVGFGCKAGLVPLHIWLPEAHPAAPADGSAFLSGLIIKLGVYGIALFAFVLLPAGPAWWGLLTMGIGALSAVLGILYALMERELKRFLAYSSIENVGIIVTALGAAMTFASSGQKALATLLLVAALYHVINHGIAKAMLFLEAGVVEHAAGTRDMDGLGGLIHRMPVSTATALAGTLSLAALPPLNGFVSEWLIFQGLFQGFRVPSHLVGTLIVLAGASLALTGGLAINAFIRYFGIAYLGRARSAGARQADEHAQPRIGPAFLATLCVALGAGAPLVLVALTRVGHSVTGLDIRPQLVIGNLTVIPAHTNFSAFSPTYLAVFLIAVTAVPALIYLAGRPRATSRHAPVWDGGITEYRARMQYTATTFANPVRVTFNRLYRPDVQIERASDDPAGRSGPVRYHIQVFPLFEHYLYAPAMRAVRRMGRVVAPIQSGDVNLYLLYVFFAILVVYLVVAV